MKTIPLIKPDLPSFEEVEDSLRTILESGRITNFGKYVNKFEEEISTYLGTHAITVSSGTAGLILSLQALGLKPGQKVVVPSFTFMATAQAVLYAGGIPIFAEIDKDLNLSVSDLELLLKQHDDIDVVLPVHIFGLPCQVDTINSLVENAAQQRSRPIAVLYDAAHAFGSAVQDRAVGAFGNAEVFSLSATKVLVSVEGGVVSSNDIDLINRIRKMRNYGIEENYDSHWPGFNSKMSEFHAIIGLYNLRRLKSLLADRQIAARYYLEQIENRTTFQALPWPEKSISTFKDFTVLVPETLVGRRETIINLLKGQGIETRTYFHPPLHRQHFFRRFADRSLPYTDNIANRVLTLPFYTSISNSDVDYVIDALVRIEKELL